MTRYEYIKITLSPTGIKRMNRLGYQGWRVVSMSGGTVLMEHVIPDTDTEPADHDDTDPNA